VKQSLEQVGLDAVDRFLDTWNSRDAALWASSLNYPHVRPSPFGTIVVYQDADEYISKVDYERVVATGWDHSEWDYKQVIHTSPQKIHVAGQWSRYDINENVIHTNPIVYIVTKVDNSWGIQSRFGADHVDDEYDTSGLETRAFHLLSDFSNYSNSNNVDACAELLNYPHYVIGVGQVSEHLEPAQFAIRANHMEVDSLLALQTGKQSLNAGLDITVENDAGSQVFQAVVNVTLREDHLGIQGWSLLKPDAEEV